MGVFDLWRWPVREVLPYINIPDEYKRIYLVVRRNSPAETISTREMITGRLRGGGGRWKGWSTSCLLLRWWSLCVQQTEVERGHCESTLIFCIITQDMSIQIYHTLASYHCKQATPRIIMVGTLPLLVEQFLQ